MSYAVTILRRAQKELAALPQTPIRGFATPSMRWPKTQDHPAVSSCRVGRDGESASARTESFTGFGDAQQTVTVLHIGHRRDVYR